MAEDMKKYPVYKYHLIEVTAVQKLAERLKAKQEMEGPKDYTYFFMVRFCERLQIVSDLLGKSTGDIVMCDWTNRRFIEEISTWLKKNPEVLTA